MPFIEVIDYEHATGRLREIYDGLIESRGRLADVHMFCTTPLQDLPPMDPKSI